MDRTNAHEWKINSLILKYIIIHTVVIIRNYLLHCYVCAIIYDVLTSDTQV